MVHSSSRRGLPGGGPLLAMEVKVPASRGWAGMERQASGMRQVKCMHRPRRNDPTHARCSHCIRLASHWVLKQGCEKIPRPGDVRATWGGKEGNQNTRWMDDH